MGNDTQSRKFQLVLAGNPNCGKSTIFNVLTGTRQHVGNYPGVTVEKKYGTASYQGQTLSVVDLPGMYSMNAHSEDEEAARQYLLENRENGMVLVNVLDSSNFERNLFLTLQLRELGVPMLLVLNMSDLARQRGIEFRKGEISEWLRLPVLECVGSKGIGVKEILAECAKLAADSSAFSEVPQWLKDLNEKGILPNPLPEQYQSEPVPAKGAAERTEAETASLYYEAISRIVPEMALNAHGTETAKISFLDKLFLHRFLGLPLFFLMLYLIFQLTFTVGEYPMGWIESGVEALSEKLGSLWPEGSESLLKSLILDGIIAGVGGVLVFLPNIVLLFFAIALLEDSGYMARAAVIMDRFMAKIGLHGKSFIPMLIGFGCTVPGIMAARTLENSRERLATMFVLPLMSCGARMPIYLLIIPAFFPGCNHGAILFGVYVIGIFLAILLAKILRVFVLRGEPIPFVMELPQWHVPTCRTVGVKTLERGWLYVKKAGTVILALSVVLWALLTFPQLPEEKAQLCADEEEVTQMAMEYSYGGRIGKVIEPVMSTMGMDWKAGTAFLGAFAAKEVFVAQMAIVYHAPNPEDEEAAEEGTPAETPAETPTAVETAVPAEALAEAAVPAQTETAAEAAESETAVPAEALAESETKTDAEEDEDVSTLGLVLREQYAQVDGEFNRNRGMLIGWCFLIFSLIATPCMVTFAVMARESSWKWAFAQYFVLTSSAWVICTLIYQIATCCFGI